jgi:hypothetical protein
MNRTASNAASQLNAYEQQINAIESERAAEMAICDEIVIALLDNKPTQYGTRRTDIIDAADVQSEIDAYEEAEAFAYYLKADHIEYARRMAALRTAAIGRVAARMAGLVLTYRRKCEAQEDGA